MIRQNLVQRWSGLLLLSLLASLLLCFAIPQIAYRIARHVEEGRQDGLNRLQLKEAERRDENQIIDLHRISQEINRSIVRIHSPGDAEAFGKPLGFGVIVDSRALAVTSLTLVAGMTEVPLQFAGHPNPIYAKLVASDELSDLALLEFSPPPSGKISVRLIAKSPPKLGQHVIAMADVTDRRNTLRIGVVLRRGTQASRVCVRDIDFIGTNVASDFNIGSPLLNMHGEVLGICIAERSADERASGHVLPAVAADRVISDLLRFGRARHGWIGVFLHADVVAGSGMVETSVAHVDYVVPGSPAEKSGLRAGDDIMLMNQHVPVVGITDLQRLILSTVPPEAVRLSVLRAKSFEVVTVPVETQPLLAPSLPGEREWDFTIHCPLEPPRIDPDAVQPGVALISVGERLQHLGLRPGDAIVGINGIPTPNLEFYCRQATPVVAAGTVVRLDILHRGQTRPRSIDVTSQ